MKKKIVSIIVCAVMTICVMVPASAANTRVTGLSATSNVDQRVVSADWDTIENADKYEVQISRSRSDWSEADLYTTYGNQSDYSVGHRRYNHTTKHYTVDYDVTDTYYARVRPIVDEKAGMWSRAVKTKIVTNDPIEVDLSRIKIEDQEDLYSLLKAYDTLKNMYKPTWN